jgi:hypothetical protein
MILNVKLEGSEVIESHEIRPLLINFAPEAWEHFTRFFKDNFSEALGEKLSNHIF